MNFSQSIQASIVVTTLSIILIILIIQYHKLSLQQINIKYQFELDEKALSRKQVYFQLLKQSNSHSSKEYLVKRNELIQIKLDSMQRLKATVPLVVQKSSLKRRVESLENKVKEYEKAIEQSKSHDATDLLRIRRKSISMYSSSQIASISGLEEPLSHSPSSNSLSSMSSSRNSSPVSRYQNVISGHSSVDIIDPSSFTQSTPNLSISGSLSAQNQQNEGLRRSTSLSGHSSFNDFTYGANSPSDKMRFNPSLFQRRNRAMSISHNLMPAKKLSSRGRRTSLSHQPILFRNDSLKTRPPSILAGPKITHPKLHETNNESTNESNNDVSSKSSSNEPVAENFNANPSSFASEPPTNLDSQQFDSLYELDGGQDPITLSISPTPSSDLANPPRSTFSRTPSQFLESPNGELTKQPQVEDNLLSTPLYTKRSTTLSIINEPSQSALQPSLRNRSMINLYHKNSSSTNMVSEMSSNDFPSEESSEEDDTNAHGGINLENKPFPESPILRSPITPESAQIPENENPDTNLYQQRSITTSPIQDLNSFSPSPPSFQSDISYTPPALVSQNSSSSIRIPKPMFSVIGNKSLENIPLERPTQNGSQSNFSFNPNPSKNSTSRRRGPQPMFFVTGNKSKSVSALPNQNLSKLSSSLSESIFDSSSDPGTLLIPSVTDKNSIIPSSTAAGMEDFDNDFPSDSDTDDEL